MRERRHHVLFGSALIGMVAVLLTGCTPKEEQMLAAMALIALFW